MNDSGRRSFSFPKKERLTSKKEIEGLFQDSSSFYLHPLILRYRKASEDADCHKILLTAPKKNFKRAVDRNLIKRRLKEAYRLNKALIGDLNTFYHIGFVYVGKTILTYQQIEDKLKSLLLRLKKQAKKD